MRDIEQGKQRLDRWRSQLGFATREMFEKRLAQLSLDEDEFAHLLGRPAEDLLDWQDDFPEWAGEIERVFAERGHLQELPLCHHERDRPESSFLHLLHPLLSSYGRRLRDEIQSIEATSDCRMFDRTNVDKLLFSFLPTRVYPIILRTLALELQVAGLRGVLSGETPQQRFKSYIERIRQPSVALELLREYPVMARQIVNCLDGWLETSLEFLNRWSADWQEICATFSPNDDPGPLVAVEAGGGDTHRGGRAVLIAKCRSGLRIAYKPKSLAVDAHFQELLDWLNQRGFSPTFRKLRILDRGRYGWQEFVTHASCTSRDQIARFYRRHGGYLAILYALAAADFHHENVIAAGEHPILIDLEVLFHPQEPAVRQPTSDAAVVQAFEESVLTAGLLPFVERARRDSLGFDLSGMGAEPGQKLPWKYPTWQGLGTDKMKLVRETEVLDSDEHLPSVNGTSAKVLEFVGDIEMGFRGMYELLRYHKTELMADGGQLDRFDTDEVRVVIRATRRYDELLDESYHPDLLRDALDRDRHFDRLWEEVKCRPFLQRLIAAECADLWNGDVPFFSTRPSSRDLLSSTGQRFDHVHPESGMECVRRRFKQLDAEDLQKQIWFLRAALATLPADVKDDDTPPGYDLVDGGPVVDKGRLLSIARAVADRLDRQALRGSDDANWIGLSLSTDETWSLEALGTDLYEGLPGVILFLAYLGKIESVERYTSLAHAALQTLRRWLRPDTLKKNVTSIGGYSGWGGIFYTYAHLSVLWNDPDLLSETDAFIEVLPDLIRNDNQLDIMSGSAGCIAGLRALYRVRPSSSVSGIMVQCGDRLLSHAKAMPRGLGWDSPRPGTPPLAGFSHGAAGISWALAHLASLVDQKRFREAAREGIEYERSLFVAEEGNWPDLRPDNQSAKHSTRQPPSCMTAWCHGAPGIGLARLDCIPQLDDALLRAEIDVAVRTTLARGFGHNHCLCHGDLGNLELPVCASRLFTDSLWTKDLARLIARIVNSIDRHGWYCASPLGVESPGLMTGYSGIGYAMLRLADPNRVPSVLTLAPPSVPA